METESFKIKKRRSDTCSWKRNILKKAKVKGTEHVTYSGKLMAERRTGEDCSFTNILFKKDMKYLHDLELRLLKKMAPKYQLYRHEYEIKVNANKTKTMVTEREIKKVNLQILNEAVEKNDAETDQEEKKELTESLAKKKLPTEGCTGRNSERETSSGQKKISDDRQQ
ncbi:hypothetical protein ANN_13579 [Periplaneta americana]|uniref:Uncharacterized protein n=1 Tax=Periplaneta americana TaxID=6978 RepID=A0ABQ8TK93_PERAM|nr:hypothetical protein ANN_13579 [Periplaneta americana]